MLPNTLDTNSIEFDTTVQTSNTYKMRLLEERINGNIDTIESVKQAIYKILNTERYAYLIYSWNYGIELKDLIGADSDYVIAELPNRISEALLIDERIESVDKFNVYKSGKKSIMCECVAHSIYGDIEVQKEVVM